MMAVKIHPSWAKVLAAEFEKPYFQQLIAFIKAEKSAGKQLYPPGPLIFNAFDSTPFEAVRVVILGQDPYHNHGQAMGLSFSVPRGQLIPPSLRNIYLELENSLGIPPAAHGDLSSWASQGVFLLNAMLTVEQHQAGSHQKAGWQHFTDAAIEALGQQREGLVFMLWGAYAQKKKSLIDATKHLVLESVHPSPLSAHRGFLGNQHFKMANEYLVAQGQPPIHWALPT